MVCPPGGMTEAPGTKSVRWQPAFPSGITLALRLTVTLTGRPERAVPTALISQPPTTLPAAPVKGQEALARPEWKLVDDAGVDAIGGSHTVSCCGRRPGSWRFRIFHNGTFCVRHVFQDANRVSVQQASRLRHVRPPAHPTEQFNHQLRFQASHLRGNVWLADVQFRCRARKALVPNHRLEMRTLVNGAGRPSPITGALSSPLARQIPTIVAGNRGLCIVVIARS